METFLSFIIISVLVLYLAGQLGKWLLRRWISKKQKEFAEKFGQQAGGGGFSQFYGWSSANGPQRGENPKREGEIKVQRTAREEKKASKQVGEYVDYVEEVEE